jgi:hypothetical protein
MTSATSISLGGASFELDLGIVSAIAAVVCCGLFIVQLVTSAVKRDGGGIGRALRGLVVATVGCAVTLASLDLVLAAVDRLCSGVVSLATGDSISTLGSKIIDPAMFTGLVAGPGAILILSLIAIAAVAAVWFALVVRKMLIIITAIFAPLAFAGGVADLSRGWVRKWLEAMLALVFSKLILILIFIIGLGVLGGMGSPQNAVGLSRITADITGLLILLVAGLSPWMALKLVHFTGEHMASLAGSANHATSGVSRVIGAPQKVASMKSAAMSLGATQRRAHSSVGARPTVDPKNSDTSKTSRDPSTMTMPGLGTVITAGHGVTTPGGGERVTRATGTSLHAPQNAAHSVTQGDSQSVGSLTSRGEQPVSDVGGRADTDSWPASGRTTGGRPVSSDSPSVSPSTHPPLSTSPRDVATRGGTTGSPSSPHHATTTGDDVANSPTQFSTPQATPHSPLTPTSFPSSVPPLRFSPPPKDEKSS